ncbi:MAG: DUF202 domain-containing protein [Acidobacteriota bacterium]|jgi:uncharacterized membrane protein YidH (DUF202 family)
MVESEDGRHWPDVLVSIESALHKFEDSEDTQVRLLGEQNQLARRRTRMTSKILPFLSTTSLNTEKQTAMAQERTALTREQTRLSTRSTELANIRTDLGRERTSLAEQRTDLAVQRTEMSRRRTSLAEGRNKLAEQRTTLAESRTSMAENRTLRARTRSRLSFQRTELARERTYLALIRTGLAFLTLGISLFRYFGPSPWSIFDGGLVIASLFMVTYGLKGYRRAQRVERSLTNALAQDAGFADLL